MESLFIVLVFVLISFCLASSRKNEPQIVNVPDGSKILCFHCEEESDRGEWYSHAVFYQVYPRSFMDSDNDGNGDLEGIRMKLPYLKELGVDGIWMSPIFYSPQQYGGYDIQSYYDIDPMYGTMKDFDRLILDAKRLDIKIILDFVPNHTSDQHEWFKKSVAGVEPYDDYYIWVDGIDCLPPSEWNPKSEDPPCKSPSNWISNWVSVGGSAWEWSWEREKFYLHQFAKEQPDLNFANPSVRQEFERIFEFWMGKGVDGFRVDAINFAFEDEALRDESVYPGGDPTVYNDYYHNYTLDQDKSYELVYEWRDVLDRFSLIRQINPKIMMTEAYPIQPYDVFRWFGDKESARIGAQMALNFILITNIYNASTSVLEYEDAIKFWLDNTPEWEQPNWVLGNHDFSRVASRLTPEIALGLAFIEMTLPGYAVIYNGEEIGMVNNYDITWEETRDPGACNSNSSVYLQHSRDPFHTPFQWDSSVNSGFNRGKKPWLPVHQNYKELNLEVQRRDPKSFFNLYKTLIRLRKKDVFRYGSTDVFAYEQDEVLAVSRINKDETFITLMSLNSEQTMIDLKELGKEFSNYTSAMVILSSKNFQPGEIEVEDEDHPIVSFNRFVLEPYSTVIVKPLTRVCAYV